MLRQEELAFLKAMSTLQLSPVILREMKLAMSLLKEEASGAVREPRHHIWWGQSPTTIIWRARGQPQIQRANKLGRLV
jgi:hypothetical protein